MALGTTSVRDRTSEFASVLQAAQVRKQGRANVNSSSSARPPRRSEFANAAAAIGKDIASTSAKLQKLTKLAQRRSLFDDPTTEIQELTFVIKQDISSLNSKLERLAAMQTDQRRVANKQAVDHSGSVVEALKTRLVHTATDFKDVLKMRTESLQAQQTRRNQFLGGDAADAKGRQGSASSTDAVALDLGAGSLGAAEAGAEGADAGRGPAEFRMQMQQARSENTYLRARADAVRQVESTIAELGQIFNQLATMVSQQGELVERIDANVEDTLVNMEEGQNQLIQYYNAVSSNRGLMLKSMGVLLFFLILWIFLA